jgi:hypothetical protein
MSDETALRAIKVTHTLVWAIFAGCILAIPFFAWRSQMRMAVILIVVVMIEVAVLIVNRMRCPLTDVAARYTNDRDDNFDIYLPPWLARYNKHIFGTLFALGVTYTLLKALS